MRHMSRLQLCLRSAGRQGHLLDGAWGQPAAAGGTWEFTSTAPGLDLASPHAAGGRPVGQAFHSLAAVGPRQAPASSGLYRPQAPLLSLRHFSSAPLERAAPPVAGGPAGAPQASGWTRGEVANWPNAVSLARLLSGPVIALWIIDERWALALPALAVAGASDWADGFLARRLGQQSVLGTYLDPLADKALICSVVGALGYTGALPAPLVAVILGRDVALVGGGFAARAQSLGWTWPGAREFFRVAPPPPPPAASSEPGPGAAAAAGAAAGPGAEEQQGGAGGGAAAPPAPRVEPLLVSKVNTVLQLGLVGAAMSTAWLGWPGPEAVWAGGAATAGTTLWSAAAYAAAFRRGELLAPGRAAAEGGPRV